MPYSCKKRNSSTQDPYRDGYGECKTLITDYNAYTTCKKHRYTVPKNLRSSHNSTISTVSSGFTVPKRTKRANRAVSRTQHNVLSTNKRPHGCLGVARPYPCPAQCMHLVWRGTSRLDRAPGRRLRPHAGLYDERTDRRCGRTKRRQRHRSRRHRTPAGTGRAIV